MGMFAGRKDIIGKKHIVEKKAISLFGRFSIDEHALKDEYKRRDRRTLMISLLFNHNAKYRVVENYLSNE